MENNYFFYNGKKYIIQYEDGNIKIYTDNNGNLEALSNEEYQEINQLLNAKYGYIYNSAKLDFIVDRNPNMGQKEYIMSCLNWIENLIPIDCRDNFYRNISTLQFQPDLTIPMLDEETDSSENKLAGFYDTKNNQIGITRRFQKDMWRMAQKSNNPEDYYWHQYSSTILHELLHMASVNYNSENDFVLSGFSRYPAEKENEKNVGLTEGLTEVLTFAGVPGTDEELSSYYIEARLIIQLASLVGNKLLERTYFSNLGTNPLEEKLNEIINNPNKSYALFRNIELNYNLKEIDEEQNVLGNIQLSMLDYLDKKVQMLIADNETEKARNLLFTYDSVIISPETLKMKGKNPSNFVGIDESVMKFELIKDKYKAYYGENSKTATTSKANT